MTELEAKAAELEAAMIVNWRNPPAWRLKKGELEGKITALQGQVEALTAKKSELEIKAIAQMTAKYEALEQLAALKDAPAAEAGDKYGLGMVTSIGSLDDATEEKPGAAQVNTTVCSLVLDAEGKIKAVTWDVQQSKITFSHEGKPVDLPEELLTKLEKGDAYGMKGRSEIGKEWFEQIGAFSEYAIGKTVEEMLNLPVTTGPQPQSVPRWRAESLRHHHRATTAASRKRLETRSKDGSGERGTLGCTQAPARGIGPDPEYSIT